MIKKILILISIILLFIGYQFIFSYTIIEIPREYGTNTYVGGSKYDFPKCIVNPLKTKLIKKKILNGVEQIIEEQLPYTDEEIQAIKYAVNYNRPYDSGKYYEIRQYEYTKRFFLDSLNGMQDFDIVSVAISMEGMGVNKITAKRKS